MRIKELHKILQEKKNGKVTQNDIAQAIGTSRANVSKLFSKNSFINDEKIKKIEEYFNVKLSEASVFIEVDYYPEKLVSVRDGKAYISDKHVKFKMPLALFDIKDNAKYFMFHPEDNSMYPLIMKNDFVVAQCADEIFENDKVYVFVYNGSMYIRRLVKNIKEIVAEAENKNYKIQNISQEDMKSFYIIGKVVNIIRGENSI